MKHLFLTGEKQVGKSTLIDRFLSGHSCTCGGFFTRRLRSDQDGLFYTHLLKPGEKPSAENILFCCSSKGSALESAARFEKLGCSALENTQGFSLILMDELGPHEEAAIRFQHRVFEILDGDIPVLGVLQKADSPFLARIASHPQVQVLSVTEQNRNVLRLQDYFDSIFP